MPPGVHVAAEWRRIPGVIWEGGVTVDRRALKWCGLLVLPAECLSATDAHSCQRVGSEDAIDVHTPMTYSTIGAHRDASFHATGHDRPDGRILSRASVHAGASTRRRSTDSGGGRPPQASLGAPRTRKARRRPGDLLLEAYRSALPAVHVPKERDCRPNVRAAHGSTQAGERVSRLRNSCARNCSTSCCRA